MATIISNSANETEQLGERVAKALKGKEVIALFGGLGMGKTAFTRGLARGFGIDEGVSSPTFALVNEYRGSVTAYKPGMTFIPRAFLTTSATACW